LYNSSILSVTNLTTPSVQNIAPTDLFSGLESVLGGDISTSTSELNPDSANSGLVDLLAADFADLTNVPHQDGALGSATLPSADAYPLFWAILTLPPLLFQANWLNPYPVATSQLEPVSVDILDAMIRAVIPQWTFILYLIASLAVYFWCVGGMCFALHVQGAPSTPFEVIDFASRIASNRGNNSLSKLLEETCDGNTNTIREKLEDKNLFLRNVGSSENGEEGKTGAKIGFASDDKMGRLQKGQVLQ
jgi:hypothetical protein